MKLLHLPGGTEKPLKTSIRKVSVPPQVWTWHPSNTSQKCYQYHTINKNSIDGSHKLVWNISKTTQRQRGCARYLIEKYWYVKWVTKTSKENRDIPVETYSSGAAAGASCGLMGQTPLASSLHQLKTKWKENNSYSHMHSDILRSHNKTIYTIQNLFNSHSCNHYVLS